MPTKVVSSQDGPRLTVNTLMKSPTTIPARVLSMLNQQFLVDAVLRQGNDAPSGAVLYYESTPLFSDSAPAVLDEWGEIPIGTGSLGIPRVVRTVRRALGVRVSKTMRDRNDMNSLNVQITQVKNTMIVAWENAFFSALIANPSVQTMTTDTVWSSSSSHIRKDVNAAKFLIRNASTDGNGQNGIQKLGFIADTLVLSTQTETDFLDSNEVASPYVGNIASEALRYTGKLPNKFVNLDVVTSWRLDVYAFGCAMVLQRNVVGFISDERGGGANGVEATPMYGEGNGPNGGKTESWRADFTRQSAIGIDQPLAAVIIHGVHA